MKQHKVQKQVKNKGITTRYYLPNTSYVNN